MSKNQKNKRMDAMDADIQEDPETYTFLDTPPDITFSDVSFRPRYSTVRSRFKDVDLTSRMPQFGLPLPVISANMKDVTGVKMAIEMARYGAMGILHRFLPIPEAVAEYQQVVKALCGEFKETRWASSWRVGVSVGVKKVEKKRFVKLLEAGAKIFCVDVAHGHHVLVREMLAFMNKEAGRKRKDLCFIAGNVATGDGAKALVDWGSDIQKIGIGGGSVCQTRQNTGVGVPQLSALIEARQAVPEGFLISDGGIKTTGCIAKALKFANAVMIGSLFSGTSETPGHVYEDPKGQFYKVYGGSASGEHKVKNGQDHSFVEGMMTTVPFRGHVKYVLRKIKQNLQSSFSYSGARTYEEFVLNSELRLISGGGRIESKL